MAFVEASQLSQGERVRVRLEKVVVSGPPSRILLQGFTPRRLGENLNEVSSEGEPVLVSVFPIGVVPVWNPMILDENRGGELLADGGIVRSG